MNELTNITYTIHTEDNEIAKVVGLKQARQYVADMADRAGVAVKFSTERQPQMVMSAKSFYIWGARLENLIYA